MKCRKCRADLPDNAKFCCFCGVKQDITCKPRTRGNGQGSIYQLPNKSWIAVKALGYTVDEQGKLHKKIVSKSGFKTKKEAVLYLPQLQPKQEQNKLHLTFDEIYERWKPTHKVGASTMGNYQAAKAYFRPVWEQPFSEIDIDDLQDCMDDCLRGKRTQENMKALCGLLYKYAIPRHIATLNLGQYLVVGGESGSGKDGLPLDALEKIKANIGTVPYAEYVVAQCYLGLELLSLTVSSYDAHARAFVGGSKTDAGRDRVVTVSPKIQPIIDTLTRKPAGAIFCAADGGFLALKSYRQIFYDVLDACGVDNPVTQEGGVNRHKYTPHSCRHTFATLLKGVNAPDKDKLELIGHTNTEMLRHYQDVAIDDLRKITDAL